MTAADGLELLHSGLLIIVQIAGPVLLLSMAVGIIISIFQAATQIHEQTITFVPKLVVLGLFLFAGGSWMQQLLVDFMHEIYQMM